MTIYHKLKTLRQMTLESDDLKGDLSKRVKINLGQLRIRLAQERPFTYTTNGGFRFACLPASKTSLHLYFNGSSEALEMRIAGAWAQPGDACLDVGANVGYYTALLAARVGRGGCILAVEPAPGTFVLLREAIELLRLPQVRLENICVSDANHPVDFMVAASDVDSVFQSMSIGSTQAAGFELVRVQAKTIDSLIEAHDLKGKISLVKIDIEGAEPLALQGAATLFEEESLPLFIIELNRASLANFGYSIDNTTGFFPRDLFEAYLVNFNYWEPQQRYRHGVPYPWQSTSDELPDICNMIFVPKAGQYQGRRNLIAALLAGSAGQNRRGTAREGSAGLSQIGSTTVS